jgi:DNA gyrase subunit B
MVYTRQEEAYTAASIEVLSGLEHIRRRPAMYIGDVGAAGLHYLAEELIAQAAEAARAVPRGRVEVELRPDGACRIADNGSGLPAGVLRAHGARAFEFAFTTVPWGHQGLANPAANALSAQLVVEVRRDGQHWRQEHARGQSSPSQQLGPTDTTGTAITFLPDPLIFTAGTAFSFDRLVARALDLAASRPGLTLALSDQRTNPPQSQSFFFADGVGGLARHVNASRGPVHPTICHARFSSPQGQGELALQWCAAPDELALAFVNGYRVGAGTHVNGLRAGVARGIVSHLPHLRGLLTGEAIRAGLTAILALELQEPYLSGATRERLHNPEVEALVRAAAESALAAFLGDHPTAAEAIAARLLAP